MAHPDVFPPSFPWREEDGSAALAVDVQILTAGKRRIPAHSKVLASASPVLKRLAEERPREKRCGKEKAAAIPILGVPHDAVNAFLRFLYSPLRNSPATEGEETAAAAADMAEHGVHLLVLSHVYQVCWLKRACGSALASRLAAEGVVDMLVLARWCDAPRLHLRCMKLIADEFTAVEQTEAWRFLQEKDPLLELDILQSLQDAHLRRRRRRRRMEEQRLYAELSEAMECLQHICTEGCDEVAPAGREAVPPRGSRSLCPNPTTCRGLQQLVRHLASCNRQKQRHLCPRCKRLSQLLRLHASICVNPDLCRVPLCSQFKQKMEQWRGEERNDEVWRLLVKKVASARVMSCLAKRKWQEGVQDRQL